MIRKYIHTLLFVIPVLTSCGKIDNYGFPNGDVYGKVTDQITGEGIQAEQPNGFNIKLFEKGGMLNSPITTSGKPDGTFENALIFQNQYKVLACEGAFFTPDTIVAQIGDRTEVNFTVTPYLVITNAIVTVQPGQITATYGISVPKFESKIQDRITLVSSYNTVNSVVYDNAATRKSTSLTGVADATITATAYTDVITGLASGKTYYVRIASRTNNSLKRYNYSKVFKVTIP